MTETPAADGASLYVHWPFCVSKCPYCDFNSHVADRIDERAWRDALIAELDHYAATTEYRVLNTVFFGGGTPSLMLPQTVGAILDAAARNWSLSPDLEATLEANPSSAEAGKFRGFRTAGINRLSIGAQSFDNDALRFLGRMHDGADAKRAIELAAREFDRYSFDMIYALPAHQPTEWRQQLQDAMTLAGDHLSLYQLTVEKGTPFFAAHRRGTFSLPDDDLAVELLEIADSETRKAGYPAYEVSNHAGPGGECRHNLACWRGEDYIGIGPGAHGRVRIAGRRCATDQIPEPSAWLDAARRSGHGTRNAVPLNRTERVEELLITGLRLVSGIDREAFRRAGGREPEELLDMGRVSAIAREGLLRLDGRGLRARRVGRLRLNALIAALTPLPEIS